VPEQAVPNPRADRPVSVTVARSGGFAGLTRTWSATATGDDRDEWMPLIDACPWRAPSTPSPARDQFVWTIAVRAPRRRRTAVVPEHDLVAPWRALIDRVRSTDDAVNRD
jgi:hypothetical protein